MMKRLGVWTVLLLAGCSGNIVRFESAEGLTLDYQDSLDVVEEVSVDSTISESLDYVAMLLGLGETRGAELELANVIELIEVEGLRLEDYPEIEELETLIASAEDTSSDYAHAHDFSGTDAIQLAIEVYGASDDIVYMYDEMPEHYGDDLIGYYVALKSVELEEQGADDPIVLLLFVGEDGSIAEL